MAVRVDMNPFSIPRGENGDGRLVVNSRVWECNFLSGGKTGDGFQPVLFSPRPLKNLLLIDEVESLSPICDMKVSNLFEEETKQMYALTGKGPRSSLKVLRPGQTVSEIAVSPLPGSPNGVWTIKESKSQEFDSFIVVSFKDASLVLSVGDTVEEV